MRRRKDYRQAIPTQSLVPWWDSKH